MGGGGAWGDKTAHAFGLVVAGVRSREVNRVCVCGGQVGHAWDAVDARLLGCEARRRPGAAARSAEEALSARISAAEALTLFATERGLFLQACAPVFPSLPPSLSPLSLSPSPSLPLSLPASLSQAWSWLHGRFGLSLSLALSLSLSLPTTMSRDNSRVQAARPLLCGGGACAAAVLGSMSLCLPQRHGPYRTEAAMGVSLRPAGTQTACLSGVCPFCVSAARARPGCLGVCDSTEAGRVPRGWART